MSGIQPKVIVIGASAGGVEALNAIFAPVKKPFRAPVAVVLHVAPRGSILVSAFNSGGGFEIKEAEDKEPFVGGKVYFAPPNYHLLLEENGTLSFSVEEPVHFARPSIDVLFQSAAEAYGENVVGVLLTGANEDGAEGLKAIHEAGGITVVQDPQSAQCGIMPGSALKLFNPTHTLSLEKIGEFLVGLT